MFSVHAFILYAQTFVRRCYKEAAPQSSKTMF